MDTKKRQSEPLPFAPRGYKTTSSAASPPRSEATPKGIAHCRHFVTPALTPSPFVHSTPEHKTLPPFAPRGYVNNRADRRVFRGAKRPQRSGKGSHYLPAVTTRKKHPKVQPFASRGHANNRAQRVFQGAQHPQQSGKPHPCPATVLHPGSSPKRPPFATRGRTTTQSFLSGHTTSPDPPQTRQRPELFFRGAKTPVSIVLIS